MRRSIPLLFLLVTILLVGSAGAPVAPAAAKSCAKGKLTYKKRCVRSCPKGTRKAKKRRACVKKKAPAAPPSQPPAATPGPSQGAAPPAASAGGAYNGETDQSRAMSFTVSGGQVTDFVAGVNTYCNTSGNQRYSFDAIANVPPIPIQPDGSFHYEGTSDEGNPVIDGKIAGATATGTVGMMRGDSNYSGGQLTFGSCSASDRAWTATAG